MNAVERLVVAGLTANLRALRLLGQADLLVDYHRSVNRLYFERTLAPTRPADLAQSLAPPRSTAAEAPVYRASDTLVVPCSPCEGNGAAADRYAPICPQDYRGGRAVSVDQMVAAEASARAPSSLAEPVR